MTARTASGRRRSVQNFPYSVYCPATSNNSLGVGTNVYSFERTQPFSLEFFINPITIPANGNIFAECETGSPFRGIFVRHETTTLRFSIINTLTTNEAKSSWPAPPIGQWTHVILTYDGSSDVSGQKAYYNGVLQTKTVSTPNNLSATIVAASAPTKWGAFSTGSTGANAYLIPRRVLNYELSQAQVNSIWYDNQVTGTAALDQYNCTEGSGTTITSTGTAAHNLTFSGATIAWNSTFYPNKARTVIPQNRLSLS